MKIDRMELDDCGSPERLLITIFRQVGEMPLPVPVEEIASQVGISEIRRVPVQGFEGGLIANPSKSEGIVLVNERNGPERTRFTIGHELGHFLVPTHRPMTDTGFRCTTLDFAKQSAKPGDRAAQMEVEANRFSAGLLMPAKPFRDDMRKLRGVEIEHVLSLAIRYGTSKEATARNYVTQHDETCAAIISQAGKIKRTYRNKLFPFIPLSSGEPVPPSSWTARYSPGKRISDWSEVAGDVWLKDDNRGISIFEQVLVQASDFRLTLLTCDTPDEEGETEDEELEESYAVRFHRR